MNIMDETIRRIKALSDPGRLQVLVLIGSVGEICVCKIEEQLDMPQPTVSRHLNRLRESGWLSARRQGKWVHYRLADPPGSAWRLFLSALLNAGHLPSISPSGGGAQADLTCY